MLPTPVCVRLFDPILGAERRRYDLQGALCADASDAFRKPYRFRTLLREILTREPSPFFDPNVPPLWTDSWVRA